MLQRDLGRFLVDLSIALHRYAMYPAGHPSLAPVLEALARRTDAMLQDRPRFAVGVARDRLVIEGVVTESGHPLLRALAERLHRHHLSALSFHRGVSLRELPDFVAAIAEDPDRGGPLGSGDVERLRAWPHIELHPVTAGGLDIVGARETQGSGLPRSAELWVGLAQAALGRSAGPAGPEPAMEPAEVARAIDDHQQVEAYDQVIVGYLLQIAEGVRDRREPGALDLRRRVSALVSAMHPDTLRRLLAMGGNAPQRLQFLRNATAGMSAGAVIELVKAAAETAEGTVSNGLVRMLTKLAVHAEAGTPAVQPLADSALRLQVGRLTAGWALPDPNPSDYTDALQRIAQAAPRPAADRADSAGGGLADPLRLVGMCLELEEDTPALWRALDAVVDRDEVARVVQLLELSRAGDRLVSQVWNHVASAATLRRLLARQPPDFSSVDVLLPYLRGEALAPLFDVLAHSDDRRLRRAVFDRLRRTGSEGAAQAFARMAGGCWYVTRNLLALLAELERLPADCDPLPWLLHTDARVRREALRVALRLDTVRDRAVSIGLADSDARVLRLAVAAAMDHSPPKTTSRLLELAGRETLDDDLRAMVIEALVCVSRDRSTLDLLLRVVSRDGGMVRWPARAPKSHAVLAALAALAGNWPDDPYAAAAVRRATATP